MENNSTGSSSRVFSYLSFKDIFFALTQCNMFVTFYLSVLFYRLVSHFFTLKAMLKFQTFVLQFYLSMIVSYPTTKVSGSFRAPRSPSAITTDHNTIAQ